MTLVSVYDVGCSKSTEVLEYAVLVGNNLTYIEKASIITRMWVLSSWKRIDVVYVKTLEWIEGGACERTHDLATWT